MARSNSAARAKPVGPWLDRAEELYRTGNLTEALRLIDEALGSEGKTPDEAIVLRGQITYRKKPQETIAFLTKALPRLRDPKFRSQAFAMLAGSHFKLGQTRKGEQALRAAMGSPAEGYFAETLIVRGALHEAHEKYESQAGVLLEALRTILTDEPVNVYHWAQVTAQIAYLSSELPNPSLRKTAFEHVDRISWTNDLANLQFATLRAVGWRRALEGDYVNAFRDLRRAAACAPTIPCRIIAGCDRVYFLTSLGEPRSAEEELAEVAGLADPTDWWRASSGEEQLALLLLAELYAPRDGALAMSYVTRFQEADERGLAIVSLRPDRRLKAMAAYSLGCVRQHIGESSEARTLYKEAFEIYDAIGFDWRAGRAAIGLSQVSGDAATWTKIAREKLKAYPLSWLMSELNRLECTASAMISTLEPRTAHRTRGLEKLTPAQSEVYELLLRGISTREIAKKLSRSEFTVRNHIKAIFKKLEVNSRSALLSSAFRS